MAEAWKPISQLYASPLAGLIKWEHHSSKLTRPWMKSRDCENLNAQRPEDPNTFEDALGLFVALETKCAQEYERIQQQSNPEDESCPICHEMYNDYYEGHCPHNAHFRAKMLCGHVMGYSCLRKWHLQQARVIRLGVIRWSQCPMCRAEMKALQPLQSPAQIRQAKQLRIRRQLFLEHWKIAYAIRGPLQSIIDSELTEDSSFTIAAAVIAIIIFDYWADGKMGPTVAKEAVRDVADITREIIKLCGSRGAHATQKFVASTLVRANLWSDSESGKALKDFLDLFLLFVAWPDEAKEFEEYCQEVYEQKGRQTSSWINWKFDPVGNPNQGDIRERYSSSFEYPFDNSLVFSFDSSEKLISLPIDDLELDELEYDYNLSEL